MRIWSAEKHRLVLLPEMVPHLPGPDAFEALVDQLVDELAEHGSVVVTAGELQVASRLWRHAARRAGKRLGCRVSTGREGGGPDLEQREYAGPDGWSVWALLAPPE